MHPLRMQASVMRVGACWLLAAAGAASGCAHHQARGTYAYAPPYAPPVYPQPHSATQPVVAAAAPGTIPAAAVPAGAFVAAPVVSGVASAPVVATQGVPPCPPMPGATLIGSSVSGGTIVADGQTPPCPPAP